MPEYKNFHIGIALSRKVQSGFDDMSNCSAHEDIGSLLCQKKLEKKSGTTITAGCFKAVAPNGDTYFFSKTDGKIWKRAISDGTYTLVRTGTNGGYKGACYYRNNIYYTMDGFLGRYNLDATWNDNFQVLTTGVDHPLYQFDLILYIGNGLEIASLDDTDNFSSSVLDLQIEHRIKALIKLGDDLLSLSSPGTYINDSAITRWNTYSNSYSIQDEIKEVDAYAFLDADNYVYVICASGNIYLYNGNQLELFSFIRNAAPTSGHQLTANLKGKPLIANGGKVYSLHRKNRNLPFALVGEYTCSAGEDAIIHSIAACGDTLLVSWEKDGVFGVDETTANVAEATIVTPRFKKANHVKVFYDDLNGGTIEIYSKRDKDTEWLQHEVIDDSEDEQYVRTVDDMIIKAGAQAKIVIKPNPATPTISPIIDSISIS